MPEPRKPKSAPSTQGQAQAQTQETHEGQKITPAVLEALFGEGGGEDGQGGPAAGDDADANDSFLETLRQLTRQSSFITIPLLFAIVTFLFALLVFIVRGPHTFPLVELWAIGLIALAMAILQGMMLYYAGSDSGLWFLGILVGFVLFPPVLFFALDGPLASLITIVVMLVVCGVIVWRCNALVQDGYVGIVYSLGKYRRTLSPGMNFLPPWERMVRLLDTHEKRWTCPPQIVPMSPTVDIELAATISYEIIPEEAHQIALHVDQWEDQLKNMFRINLQTIAAEFQPGDFYPWQQRAALSARQQGNDDSDAGASKGKAPTWDRMNTHLFQLMRDQVAPWGVQINMVSIHDVSPRPHVNSPQGTGGTTESASTHSAPSSRPGPTRMASTAPRTNGATAKPQVRPQPTAKVQAPTAASAESSAATNNKNFDALINSYNEVRAGHITDPETIRRLASAFENIARNPVDNQAFPFDAALAASNLYGRAQRREEQISASADFPSYQRDANNEYNAYDEYDEGEDDEGEDDEELSEQTQPDWLNQLPPDDLTTGG